ncbi:sulfurtransferase [Streptomyces sp. NPDC048172]|uniref:sulfurtransferase n=1 Tax=Streptomyces sp. NPDC048172 TaxID=3365505 RepID=UPI003722AAB6
MTTGVGELYARLRSEIRPPLVLDVRRRPGRCGAESRARFREAHVPGAVLVDLESELPRTKRSPLPDLDRLRKAARRWGLAEGRRVVLYDDHGNRTAARAWWLLRWAGARDVTLLDGALDAWRDGGLLPVATGEPTAPEPGGDLALTPGQLPVLDAKEAARVARTGVLLDSPAPVGAGLARDGRFLPAGELPGRYRDLGVRDGVEVGVRSNPGTAEAHTVAALARAGVTAALYPAM